MSEATPKRCPNGNPPVVRLALARNKCPRGKFVEKVATPMSVAGYLQREYGCEAQEWSIALGIDAQNRPLGILEVSMGGIGQTAVDPRVLFAGLLLMGAGAFIFAHNHPSGEATPSQADLSLTRQLKSGAELLGIRLLDHLIITGHYPLYSFSAHGQL